jgi:hypothetical protein
MGPAPEINRLLAVTALRLRRHWQRKHQAGNKKQYTHFQFFLVVNL